MKGEIITNTESIAALLEKAIAARGHLLDTRHETAIRLFNGFLEGNPDIAIDLYAATAVIHNYADPAEQGTATIDEALHVLQSILPWIRVVILKTRNSPLAEERRGRILAGTIADRAVREHDVWYAIDLCMNRDASLYLDTRNLRGWALQHLSGKTVLNTFAYTGSLGVAALAGGAARVVQLDRSGLFLELAKTSYEMNNFHVSKKDFIVGDFWDEVSRLKQKGEHFDCVFVDPPFFAVTQKGVVDLVNNSTRMINKVRPLINDGGYLVTINNALFVSGKEYMERLDKLCADGYLKIVELIPVPNDFTGYPQTRTGIPVSDPSPFNHSTKIAILEVRRK
jgi:23S rRNA (cytosine1962-C5)-methyltransferase